MLAERISRRRNTEHQLLAGRRRPRREFVIVTQLEEAEFREQLDAWACGIDLRVGGLEPIQKGLRNLSFGIQVYLIVGNLPLRVTDGADGRLLENPAAEVKGLGRAPIERDLISQCVISTDLRGVEYVVRINRKAPGAGFVGVGDSSKAEHTRPMAVANIQFRV